MTKDYKQAIDKVNYLVWLMGPINVKDIPKDQLEQLQSIKVRLDFLLDPETFKLLDL